MSDWRLPEIRDYLQNPSVGLEVRAEWESLQSDHRLRIREFIAHDLRGHASDLVPESGKGFRTSPPDESTQALFDLERIPRLPDLHLSISHCTGFGGLVWSPRPIGLDLEEASRVQEKVILRMSSQDELKRAPDAAALWAAKEAVYKALRAYEQPQVLSQVETESWQSLDSHTETFRLFHPRQFHAPEGRGIVIRNKSHVLAIFEFQP